jgi:hypothetical protein
LPITADGANLKVNGNTVLTTSSPLSFSNLSVTGNVTANAVYTNNYFYANGAPFPQGSNSLPGTTISLKDNVIATTTLNQNLVLSANGVGNVQTNSSIMPDATQIRDIGSASNKFNSVYAGYYYGNGSQLTGMSGPVFMAYNSANQSLTGATTNLIYGTATVNTSSYYNTVTGRFTPLVAGYYQVNVWFLPELVTGTANAGFYVALYKTGSPIAFGGSTVITPTWGTVSGSSINTLVYLNGSTDYLNIVSNNTIYSGTWRSGITQANYFQAVWIRGT